MRGVADALADIAKVEQTPRWMGKQASIILAPEKPKVEAYKRKVAKEKAEALARGEKIVEPPPEPEIVDEADEGDGEE